MQTVTINLNGIQTTIHTTNIELLENGDKKYTLASGGSITIPKEQLNEGTSGKKLLLD